MNVVIAAPRGQPLTLGLALVLGTVVILALLLGLALGQPGRVSGASAGVSRTQEREASAKDASEDAFRRGLTNLMADYTDQTIEKFTRTVTLNSDTVETYVMLGNLFRQKGEI